MAVNGKTDRHSRVKEIARRGRHVSMGRRSLSGAHYTVRIGLTDGLPGPGIGLGHQHPFVEVDVFDTQTETHLVYLVADAGIETYLISERDGVSPTHADEWSLEYRHAGHIEHSLAEHEMIIGALANLDSAKIAEKLAGVTLRLEPFFSEKDLKRIVEFAHKEFGKVIPIRSQSRGIGN